jgi:hypothetical protein
MFLNLLSPVSYKQKCIFFRFIEYMHLIIVQIHINYLMNLKIKLLLIHKIRENSYMRP